MIGKLVLTIIFETWTPSNQWVTIKQDRKIHGQHMAFL